MDKNINAKAYREAIISFLEEKYDDEFEIIELVQEFEGYSGMSVRARCSKLGDSDYFTVYCYFDSTMAEEKITIEGNKHAVTDSYAEVIYQNALIDELEISEVNNCLVRCKVSFNSVQPSRYDILKGMDACLQNQELDPYVKIYILTDMDISTDEVQEKAKKLISKYSPCTGYIYLAYFNEFREDEVSAVYNDNQGDFGNFLANSDFSDRVDFILYKKETDFHEKKSVRE